MSCAYVKQAYGVPADIGRRVMIDGYPGIIAADHGHYIGVNFDADKPGTIKSAHPTWRVEYLQMGRIRPVTRSRQRYNHYLAVADLYDSFRDFLMAQKVSI